MAPGHRNRNAAGLAGCAAVAEQEAPVMPPAEGVSLRSHPAAHEATRADRDKMVLTGHAHGHIAAGGRAVAEPAIRIRAPTEGIPAGRDPAAVRKARTHKGPAAPRRFDTPDE